MLAKHCRWLLVAIAMDTAAAAIHGAAGLRLMPWAARTGTAASMSTWRALGFGAGGRLDRERIGGLHHAPPGRGDQANQRKDPLGLILWQPAIPLEERDRKSQTHHRLTGNSFAQVDADKRQPPPKNCGGFFWCTRLGSNQRPLASEANALSS